MSSTVSIRICQEGHANALALNKECTQIAVAGRSLLKVYSIEPDGFLEVCNMRGGKNQNLSYSSNDVAWSSLDNNLLATAATNGYVSVWDLSKFGRQKQMYMYTEHERTAHTVTFHSTEANLLISGSQDGTIKCFDLRVDKAIHTFFSNSESVRDVKFSPQAPNMFAAVSENGTVQLWDLKRPDKSVSSFTAHSGPIYTCDWHPTQPWLATGSRDKQIKVWKIAENKPVLEYTIHTIAVVGRVKWRPERMFHIASCALVVDYSVYIWDVRRPYIPYASFNEHTNVTTGISFKGTDPHVLISTSKDSTIYKHAFRDASRPNTKANPQATGLNQKGDLMFAYKMKNVTQSTAATASNRIGLLSTSASRSTQPVPHNDQFHLATTSCLMSYSAKPKSSNDDKSHSGVVSGVSQELMKTSLHKDYITLQGCAREYILTGGSLSEICDYNAEIARKYGKPNVGMLWNFVKNQYACGGNSSGGRITNKVSHNQSTESRNSTSSQNVLPSRIMMAQQQQQQHQAAITPGWGGEYDKFSGEPSNEEDALAKMCCEDLNLQDFRHPKSGEFKHPGGPSLSLIQNGVSAAIADADSHNNFMYGEAELTVDDMDCVKSLRNGFLYIGPHDLTKGWSLPQNNLNELQRPSKTNELEHNKPDDTPQQPNVLKIISNITCPRWEAHDVLAECLILQTDVSDVQTPVCILIALGDRRNDLPINGMVHESWLLSYIELLHRHNMWNEAAEIINMSWIRSVREMNQLSTSMHTNCGDCEKPLSTSGWYCNKCKSSQSSKCAVCNRVVTGLYAWCQGCAHGGHIEHMRRWFSNHSKCPKCGHLCEYE